MVHKYMFFILVLVNLKLVCGYLYLTESARTGKLILNWDLPHVNSVDTVALVFQDSKSNGNVAFLTNISITGIPQGWHETNYSLINEPLPGNWDNSYENPDFQQLCYSYYIVSLQNHTIIEMNCYKIQPSWMKNFSDLRLGQLMIPGTHDSGAFKSPFSPIISRWGLAQNRDLWQQLVYGIRFFDMRVGRYGDGPNGTCFNHGIVKCGPLLAQLENVAKFLKLSPSEVVILDFHEVTAPEDKIDQFHQELLETLQNLFGEQIYPFTNVSNEYGPTLSELQTTNKRLIISYGDREIVKENTWLWPDIKRYWGNKQTLNELEDYLIGVIKQIPKGNPLSSIMAELTPSAEYILKHFDKNLKYLADSINRDLDKLIRDNNRSNYINIIATDYFTGNDIINITLEMNFNKLNNKNIVITTNKLA